MFIKELNLKAFGKFVRKNIQLKDGLNLIYGNNEAGKSTIHNFIEMMFYGSRDNKNKVDESISKKYRPWNYDQYLGAMTLNNDETDIVVRRDFQHDEASIYNRIDQEEKEDLYYSKNQEVGEYLFGINKATFSNTLSIKQLSNSTNEELATEVKEKIQNLSQTKNEDISVEKIVRQLSGIKEEIGDINNPKSLISQYTSRVEELKTTRDKAIDSRNYTIHLAMEKRKLQGKINDLDRQISDINGELYDYKLTVLAEKKGKIDEVYKEINQLNEELDSYKDMKSVSIEQYENAVKLMGILQQMRDEKAKIQGEIEKITKEMIELENDPSCSISAEGFVVKINLDYNSYNEIEEKIVKLQRKVDEDLDDIKKYNTDEIAEFTEICENVNSNNDKIDRIKDLLAQSSKDVVNKLIKSYSSKRNLFFVLGFIFLALAVCSVYAGYYFGKIEYYYGAAIGVIAIVFFVFAGLKCKRISALKQEEKNIEDNQKNFENEIKQLNEANEKYLKDKNCANYQELKEKSQYYISLKSLVQEKLSQLEYDKGMLESAENKKKALEDELYSKLKMFDLHEINDDSMQKLNQFVLEKDKIVQELTKKSALIDNLTLNLDKVNKELSFEEKRLDIILTSNKIESVDELKELMNKNFRMDQIKEKLVDLDRIVDNLLENHTYEEIAEKTKELEIDGQIAVRAKEINHQERFNAIAEKEEEKNNLVKEIEKLDREIDSIDSVTRSISEIEEEIDFYQDKVDQGNEKIRVADKAIENIKMISELIKGDFMPLLRNAISDNFSYVTGGRYSDVLIDKNMNITVVSSDTGEIVNLSSLSGGTLDQLYISLRLGLATLISNNKNIPLLLDDSFIQYDEERLQKSLEILNKEKKRRQIILFTCQKREKTILDKLKIEYNNVEIV